jgi:hypothetical protein
MDLPPPLTAQLKWMQLLLDPDSGAILFRHPTLRGVPDLVVEGDGYTMEFIGPTLLCLDIQDPSGMARLLAEPVKGKLPIGV